MERTQRTTQKKTSKISVVVWGVLGWKKGIVSKKNQVQDRIEQTQMELVFNYIFGTA